MTTISERTTGSRSRYEGAGQILRFNYPMFAVAGIVGCVAVMAAAWAPLPEVVRWGLAAGVVLCAGWALATLGVSHYVYDRYPTFEFKWLGERRDRGVRRWANVHAGFDQTSVRLWEAFRGARGTPIDLFDPAVMTERSIHRARRSVSPVAGTLRGTYDHLPLADGGVDAVFMIFAAHELRRREERAALFREAARVLGAGGEVILVEHLRDVAGFPVFGPGVFHFHSRREWLLAGRAGGLELVGEIALTRFARGLIWRKVL